MVFSLWQGKHGRNVGMRTLPLANHDQVLHVYVNRLPITCLRNCPEFRSVQILGLDSFKCKCIELELLLTASYARPGASHQ
jgi:hypothetical protein